MKKHDVKKLQACQQGSAKINMHDHANWPKNVNCHSVDTTKQKQLTMIYNQDQRHDVANATKTHKQHLTLKKIADTIRHTQLKSQYTKKNGVTQMKTLKQISLLAMAFFMANECFAMEQPVGHPNKQSQLRKMANTMCDILEGINNEFDRKEEAIELTIKDEHSSNESQVEERGDDRLVEDSEDAINEDYWRLSESKQYKEDLKQSIMLIEDEQVNQKITEFLILYRTSLINLKIEACRKQSQIRQPIPQIVAVIEEDKSEKEIKHFEEAIRRINQTIKNMSQSYQIDIYNLLTTKEINKQTPINKINEQMGDNLSNKTTASSKAMLKQLKSMSQLLIDTLKQDDEEVIKYVFVNDEITKNLLFTNEIELLTTTIDNEARIKYSQQNIAQNQQRQPARAASVSSGPNSFNNTGLAKRKASKKSQGRLKRAGRNKRNGKKKNRKRRGSRTRRK